MLAANATLNAVYILKDQLKVIYRYRYRPAAKRALDDWCAMAEQVDHWAMRGFIGTLHNHEQGILNHCFHAIGTKGRGDMKIARFSFKKLAQESRSVAGRELALARYQISLTGLLSVFWKGHYWYRRSDGHFVLYRQKGKERERDPVMLLIAEEPAS